MYYRQFLFTRGAKHFNPYTKRARNYSTLYSGNGVGLDNYLMSLLSLEPRSRSPSAKANKTSRGKRVAGKGVSSVNKRTARALYFTR